MAPWGFPALTYNCSELQTLPFITDNGVVIRENCVLHSSCVSLTLHGAEWVCVCTQVQVKGRWMAHSYSMQWHCSVCTHSVTEPSCGGLITQRQAGICASYQTGNDAWRVWWCMMYKHDNDIVQYNTPSHMWKVYANKTEYSVFSLLSFKHDDCPTLAIEGNEGVRNVIQWRNEPYLNNHNLN